MNHITSHMPNPPPRHVAIIGSGIAGLSTAYHLHRLAPRTRITIFEKQDHFGGHTDTHRVMVNQLKQVVDTGFIVFNALNYPVFCAMLDDLGVDAQASDMSFSVANSLSQLTYNPSKQWSLLARPQNFFKKGFVGMIKDIVRFYKAGKQIDLNALSGDITLGSYLAEHHYGEMFKHEHLYPMCGALWSAEPGQTEQLPLKFVLGFFANHRMLQLKDRPEWLTVKGGSSRYISALKLHLGSNVQWLSVGALAVKRHQGASLPIEVIVAPQHEQTGLRFDAVVMACHADEALQLLGANATADEQSVLGAFAFRHNDMVLHTDASIMPAAKSQWASWHVHVAASEQNSPGFNCSYSISYWMNRLQDLHIATPILATLNPNQPIADKHVLKRRRYSHPIYSPASFAAQTQWQTLCNNGHTYYAGAYWGYGFHEDGAESGLRAACALLGESDDRLSRGRLQQAPVAQTVGK